MIFTSNIARGLAEDVFTDLSIMMVYSGSQPSLNQYVDDFYNYNWNGSFVLQGYFNVSLIGTNITTNNYRIVKNSSSGVEYGAFSKRSGIAAWATLFHINLLNDLFEFNTITGSINFLRNVTRNDIFMLVPVTNMSGYGVLKFNNLNFVHPHVSGSDTIENFILNFKSR